MVEILIGLDAALQEMRDLLTDVVDIVLHCVDHNHLKQRPLYEVFPPIQTFNQVLLLLPLPPPSIRSPTARPLGVSPWAPRAGPWSCTSFGPAGSSTSLHIR